jgi:DNA-binding IscR family transcriptional regulator
MKFINREMQVALDALQVLRRVYPLRLPLSTIAQELDESPSFLKQALTKLTRAKYVTARRAQPGGYQLNLGSLNRPMTYFFDDFGKRYTPNPTKPRAASERLQGELEYRLASISVSDLIKE